MILHRTLRGLSSSRERKNLGDDLSTINSMCTKVDVRGDFAHLRRVQCAGSSLWTSPGGVNFIQEACDKYDFEQAMKIQADLEMKLKSQEQLIKQLQDKVEIKNWHEKLNLNVPKTNGMENKGNNFPTSNKAALEGKSPQRSAKKGVVSATSTKVAERNAKKDDVLDLESVATSNSKSTIRDQLSVD